MSNITPGGLALRFSGLLDGPAMHVDGAIAVAREATIRKLTGPGEEHAPARTGCSSSVVGGSWSMFGSESASSVSTSITSRRGVSLTFLRVLLGVRAFGFFSVSSPLSTMRHISTVTGAFSRMSIQILTRHQYPRKQRMLYTYALVLLKGISRAFDLHELTGTFFSIPQE